MESASKRTFTAAPTIAHLKGQGLKEARVFCASIWCGHMNVVAFEDIGVSDLTPFPEVRNHRRWTCERCGNHEVSVMPNWRDPRAEQAGRMRQA